MDNQASVHNSPSVKWTVAQDHQNSREALAVNYPFNEFEGGFALELRVSQVRAFGTVGFGVGNDSEGAAVSEAFGAVGDKAADDDVGGTELFGEHGEAGRGDNGPATGLLLDHVERGESLQRLVDSGSGHVCVFGEIEAADGDVGVLER